jgi:hypothetical protein
MILDELVKSLITMSFRAKREILRAQHIETAGFLPAVEMTESVCRTFYEFIILDGLVKSLKTPFSVIPVKTGIQEFQTLLDSRLRGSDDVGDFLRDHYS